MSTGKNPQRKSAAIAKGTSKNKEIIVSGGSFFAGPVAVGEFITPENFAIVTSMISTAIGITTTAVKGIQLWVEDRKSRKIVVKVKDIEMEISGPVTESEIRQKLKIFYDLQQQISKKDVSIVLLDDTNI